MKIELRKNITGIEGAAHGVAFRLIRFSADKNAHPVSHVDAFGYGNDVSTAYYRMIEEAEVLGVAESVLLKMIEFLPHAELRVAVQALSGDRRRFVRTALAQGID